MIDLRFKQLFRRRHETDLPRSMANV
jgi:hypothetical protein